MAHAGFELTTQQLWGVDSFPRVGPRDQSQVLGPLNHLTGLSFRTQGHLTKDLFISSLGILTLDIM